MVLLSIERVKGTAAELLLLDEAAATVRQRGQANECSP
jgi:hypothetical protein